MDSEFTEEEVVENPTIRAAYNLPPLHQNQPLRWDYEVDLIGKKVFDKILHLCEVCELPILVYGRLLPCKHIFCFHCARKCETTCKRCPSKVQKLEELNLGTVYVCTHGAPKHSTKGCRRAYLSQRDLQSHIAHRHMAKLTNETKTSQSTQPQLPLTQQQAAAVLQVSQPVTVHSQLGLQTTNNQQSQQQGLITATPFMGGIRDQPSPQESGQMMTHIIPGLGDMRTGSLSTSPAAMSQASPDLKSNPMPRLMNFSPSSQNTEQGIYRPIDIPSLPHQLQQQQFQQHQRHQLQLPNQQQQQLSPLMRLPGSPGASKALPRFNQPSQMPMSSSMMNRPAPHHSPYQVTASNSSSEMQMSTHHQQQNVNLHQQQNANLHPQNVNMHQQQQFSGLRSPRSQSQLLMQHGLDQRQQDIDSDDFNTVQGMDNFGNVQNVSNLRNRLSNLDNFSSLSQRNAFSSGQDMDNFNSVKKMDSFNSPQNMDDFNTMQGGMMDTSNSSPNPQGGPSRNKNVNLITVPIQEEGQYRPLPFVGQAQLPTGTVNKNYQSFSSMPSSNYSSAMNKQTLGGASPRLPFSRSGNPQSLLSQPGNPQSHLSQANSQSHMSHQGNPRLHLPQGNPQTHLPQQGNPRLHLSQGNPQSHLSQQGNPLLHLSQGNPQNHLAQGNPQNHLAQGNAQTHLSQQGNPPLHLSQGNPQSHLSQPGQGRMSQLGNLQNRMSQPGNSLSNPGLMIGNQRGGVGGGGIRLGSNMPHNVQGAIAGVVQALSRGAPGTVSSGVMIPSSVSLAAPNNQQFSTQSTPTNWNNNLRSIQPRVTQNVPPRLRGDTSFQQNYFK